MDISFIISVGHLILHSNIFCRTFIRNVRLSDRSDEFRHHWQMLEDFFFDLLTFKDRPGLRSRSIFSKATKQGLLYTLLTAPYIHGSLEFEALRDSNTITILIWRHIGSKQGYTCSARDKAGLINQIQVICFTATCSPNFFWSESQHQKHKC